MGLSDKHVQEFKRIFKEEYGKELTDAEARESGESLVNFFEIIHKGVIEEQGWKQRLEKEPKGFSLSGNGRNCAICGDSTREDTNWYDKWGIKCLTCQKAIDKKKISGSIAKTDENRYSPYDFESRFGIKKPTLKKWVQEGILNARTILTDTGRVHYYIFLIKDNKGFLPPKKLTEPEMVAEEKDGRTWHHIEPWYKFCNPYEQLKGYRIMDYLQFVENKTSDK